MSFLTALGEMLADNNLTDAVRHLHDDVGHLQRRAAVSDASLALRSRDE